MATSSPLPSSSFGSTSLHWHYKSDTLEPQRSKANWQPTTSNSLSLFLWSCEMGFVKYHLKQRGMDWFMTLRKVEERPSQDSDTQRLIPWFNETLSSNHIRQTYIKLAENIIFNNPVFPNILSRDPLKMKQSLNELILQKIEERSVKARYDWNIDCFLNWLIIWSIKHDKDADKHPSQCPKAHYNFIKCLLIM